jgi:hypothetical protein
MKMFIFQIIILEWKIIFISIIEYNNISTFNASKIFCFYL